MVFASLILYGLAIRFLWLIRRVHIMEARALVKKCVWVFGGVACVLMSVGILQIRSHLSLQEEQQAGDIWLGLIFILAGLWVPWYILHRGPRAYIARYRGARLLPAFVMLLVIAAVAMGVALLSMGIMEVAMDVSILLGVQPPIAYVVPVLIIAGTAGVIAMGTIAIIFLLWRRLEAGRDMGTGIPGSTAVDAEIIMALPQIR
jgi:hypothetical protein